MQIDDLRLRYSTQITTGRISVTSQQINTKRCGNEEKFAKVLESELKNADRLKFSKHAQARMTERDMNLSQSQLEKLDDAAKRAAQKGVKDTLVLMENMAFIVNIPNNVVVTAMKDKDLEGNVFTQIDGAVIT
jgi:flagellar operon protein